MSRQLHEPVKEMCEMEERGGITSTRYTPFGDNPSMNILVWWEGTIVDFLNAFPPNPPNVKPWMESSSSSWQERVLS